MAIIKYSKTGRGRPATLDTDVIYSQIESNLNKALSRLSEFRKSSKGYRGESIYGTSTSLPDWISETFDLLDANEMGRKLSIKEIETIKQTAKSLRELTSKQKRVYERALDTQLTSQYIKDIEKGLEGSHSKFQQKQIQNVTMKLEKMTPVQRQKFIQSQYYQDPRTAKGRYRRVLNWSKADSGKQHMSYDEAWAYLQKRRLDEYYIREDIIDDI